jgi:hypothetical protein
MGKMPEILRKQRETDTGCTGVNYMEACHNTTRGLYSQNANISGVRPGDSRSKGGFLKIHLESPKQVWKGVGCGEGRNLSSKGFPIPASNSFIRKTITVRFGFP